LLSVSDAGYNALALSISDASVVAGAKHLAVRCCALVLSMWMPTLGASAEHLGCWLLRAGVGIWMLVWEPALGISDAVRRALVLSISDAG
jgi:hypothetical protein